MFTAFKFGLLLGFSIILSIGAQNIFIIKQGLRNEWPYVCAGMCFLCDFALILAGVSGVNAFIYNFPAVKLFLLISGVIFLFYSGCLAIKRGLDYAKIQQNIALLSHDSYQENSATKLILMALSFSVLNPQAILDTLLIISSNANHFENFTRYVFVSGAIAASFIWFFGITLITSRFSNQLRNAKFWCALEWVGGIVMLIVAVNFTSQLFN